MFKKIFSGFSSSKKKDLDEGPFTLEEVLSEEMYIISGGRDGKRIKDLRREKEEQKQEDIRQEAEEQSRRSSDEIADVIKNGIQEPMLAPTVITFKKKPNPGPSSK